MFYEGIHKNDFTFIVPIDLTLNLLMSNLLRCGLSFVRNWRHGKDRRMDGYNALFGPRKGCI